MAISHAVPLSAKCFTQEHLDLSLKYICPDVYPGLYAKSDLPKNIEFVKRKIMNISDIVIDDVNDNANKFASHNQGAFIRKFGRGQFADDVHASIEEQGFKLCKVPISVAYCPNKLVKILDGRTRLEKLIKSSFTNVIVDYYKCDDYDSFSKMAQLHNSVSDPYSPHTKADIVVNCNDAINEGWTKREYDSILARVKEIAPNSFSKQVVNKIILNVLEGAGHTSGVHSFTDAKATDWLKRNGYHDNEKGNGIYYKAIGCGSAVPAGITGVAKYLQRDLVGCNVKELRVVLHTDTLDGSCPEESFKGKIDRFRTGWDRSLDEIKNTFFPGSKILKVARLYGAVPAVVDLAEVYPMDKLIAFHVGKLKDKLFSDIDGENNLSRHLETFQ
jgi:hypothetical protein